MLFWPVTYNLELTSCLSHSLRVLRLVRGNSLKVSSEAISYHDTLKCNKILKCKKKKIFRFSQNHSADFSSKKFFRKRESDTNDTCRAI